MSANEFARRAGTGRPRVLRHLAAWDKAAKRKLVSPASVLTPADAADPKYMPLEEEYPFADYFDGTDGENRPGAAARVIDKVGPIVAIENMTQKQRNALVDAMVHVDPQLATRAMVKAERTPHASMDPKDMGRRAADKLTPVFKTDLATDALRSAASCLAEAEICRRNFGIKYPDGEADALALVDRMRDMYGNGRGKWSDNDRDFLGEMGVSL